MPVTISYSTVVNNDTIAKGDTLFIQCLVTATEKMNGYELSLYNAVNKEVYLEVSDPSKEVKYEINEYWVNNLNSITNLKLKLEVSKDKFGNKALQILNLVAIP